MKKIIKKKKSAYTAKKKYSGKLLFLENSQNFQEKTLIEYFSVILLTFDKRFFLPNRCSGQALYEKRGND